MQSRFKFDTILLQINILPITFRKIAIFALFGNGLNYMRLCGFQFVGNCQTLSPISLSNVAVDEKTLKLSSTISTRCKKTILMS